MVSWIPALLGVVAAGAWCLRGRVRPSVRWPLGLLLLAVLNRS